MPTFWFELFLCPLLPLQPTTLGFLCESPPSSPVSADSALDPGKKHFSPFYSTYHRAVQLFALMLFPSPHPILFEPPRVHHLIASRNNALLKAYQCKQQKTFPVFKWEVAPECLQNLAQMGVVKSAHARAPAAPPRRRARNRCRHCHSPGEAGSEAKDLEKLPPPASITPVACLGNTLSENTESRTDSQQGRDRGSA